MGYTSSLASGFRGTSSMGGWYTGGVRSTSVEIGLTLGFTRRLVGTMARCGFVASPGSAVANVGWGETVSVTLSKGYTFTRSTTGNAMEVGTANVTVAGLVLVVLRTSPFLETGRRIVGVWRFTSAVRSCCAVFVNNWDRAPAAQVVHQTLSAGGIYTASVWVLRKCEENK